MMYLCPHCQVSLEIEEEWRGMEVSCPVCGKDFTICEASPKKGGMVTAWVLYGIFQLVISCAALGWQIVAYSFYKDKNYWLETQSLRNALRLILNLSSTPTQIFIFLHRISSFKKIFILTNYLYIKIRNYRHRYLHFQQ